jgi:site-specific DNA-methyltransferase (adenine-specific)
MGRMDGLNFFYDDGAVKIYNGRALDLLRGLEAGSVSLAFLDPPYFRVKPLWWDRQWGDKGEFLGWMGEVCGEVRRVLAGNGSLYLCASSELAWDVEGVVRGYFNVLNSIRWHKSGGYYKRMDIETCRQYLKPWERVLFAEQWGADGGAMNESGYLAECDRLRGDVFDPIREYLAGEFRRAGVKFERANEFCGVASMAARHYFARSQWCMPTREHYESLQRGLNAASLNGSEYLRAEYEDLRAEYEDLRAEYEDLRRPFFLSGERPSVDLWTYEPVAYDDTKHPTEKPLGMLLDVVETSSREGDLVVDPFMGRGTTVVAAARLGRRFVGGDVQEGWCAGSVARLREARGEFHIRRRRGASGRVEEAAREAGQLGLGI